MNLEEITEKVDGLDKSDLMGKNFKEIAKELGLDEENSFLLYDKVNLHDMTVCDVCDTIHDNADAVRYLGHDFEYKDDSKNYDSDGEYLDGFVLCDDCYEEDKENINLL